MSRAVQSRVETGGQAKVKTGSRRVSEAIRAGVSVGLVQHYFGTKQRLVHASAEVMVEQASHWYDTIAAPPAEALRRLVNHVIPASQAARLGAVIWHAYIAASHTDEGIAGILTRAKRGQESEAIRLIREIDRKAAAKPIASRLIAHADGLAAQVLFGAVTPAAALRLIDDNIAAALAPKTSHRAKPPRTTSPRP